MLDVAKPSWEKIQAVAKASEYKLTGWVNEIVWDIATGALGIIGRADGYAGMYEETVITVYYDRRPITPQELKSLIDKEAEEINPDDFFPPPSLWPDEF